ncbi:MAG: preprotein translocase subunit SecG [Methylobacteriaceae bacterium]|jgi:preprotein translocase subunit SecG|nr:preprotein translocase subunit SecG [Methylobacteriaceae bacterium]
MYQVVLAGHLIIVLALIGVILLQRSEGGLGLGGGTGGISGLLSSRGQASALTKATAILGALFFASSLALAIISKGDATPTSVLPNTGISTTSSSPLDVAPPSAEQPAQPAGPQVPQAQ